MEGWLVAASYISRDDDNFVDPHLEKSAATKTSEASFGAYSVTARIRLMLRRYKERFKSIVH